MWNIKYCVIIYMLIRLDNWLKVIVLMMMSWNSSDCRYTCYDMCTLFVLLCHASVRGSNVLRDGCSVMFKGVTYGRSLKWHSVGGFVDGRFHIIRFKVGKQLFGHSFIHFNNPLSPYRVYLCLHDFKSFCESRRVSTNVPINLKTQTNISQLTRYIYYKYKYWLLFFRTFWYNVEGSVIERGSWKWI
jgi:hypothetical protein